MQEVTGAWDQCPRLELTLGDHEQTRAGLKISPIPAEALWLQWEKEPLQSSQ